MADESEEACLVNPKSPLNGGQMPYTDGINSVSSSSMVAGSNSFKQAQATTIHHSGRNTITANHYDINGDIILSQFHADAIKQARHSNKCTNWNLFDERSFLSFYRFSKNRLDAVNFNLLLQLSLAWVWLVTAFKSIRYFTFCHRSKFLIVYWTIKKIGWAISRYSELAVVHFSFPHWPAKMDGRKRC